MISSSTPNRNSESHIDTPGGGIASFACQHFLIAIIKACGQAGRAGVES